MANFFALGAVIYEMDTGRKSFAAETQANLIAAILERDPPPISTQEAGPESATVRALDHLVRVCLAKEPDARWQAAHDLRVELNWVAGAGSQGGTARRVVASRLRRELLLSVALGSVSMGLFALASVHFRQKAPAERPIRFSISPPEKVMFANLEAAGPVLIAPDGSRLALSV
jgi:serine/threonine protein kinase